MFGYLLDLVQLVLRAFMILIVVRAVLSWVNPDPFNPIVRFLYRTTEPVLRPVRRRVPDFGGLDISPMVVIFAIYLVEVVVLPVLQNIARSID